MRYIAGLVVPYGPIGRRGRYRFRFEPGSLSWTGSVPLLVEHTYGTRVGRAVELVDRPCCLSATLRLVHGPRADRALALGGLSARVEFQSVTKDPQVGVVVHRARLREVSLTATPAFDQARVTAGPEPVFPKGVEHGCSDRRSRHA